MQKDVVRSTDLSWAILMFLAGTVTVILIMTAVRAALFPTSNVSFDGAFSSSQETARPDTNSVARHVVVPPVLGDAVLGSSNVCGCPGCCSVLNS